MGEAELAVRRALLQTHTGGTETYLVPSGPTSSQEVPVFPPTSIVFIVLGLLMAALLVMLGLAQRQAGESWRAGCSLLLPWNWYRRQDPDQSGFPPQKQAEAAPVRMVPMIVIMPDQQLQCALEDEGSLRGADKAEPRAEQEPGTSKGQRGKPPTAANPVQSADLADPADLAAPVPCRAVA